MSGYTNCIIKLNSYHSKEVFSLIEYDNSEIYYIISVSSEEVEQSQDKMAQFHYNNLWESNYLTWYDAFEISWLVLNETTFENTLCKYINVCCCIVTSLLYIVTLLLIIVTFVKSYALGWGTQKGMNLINFLGLL